MLRVEPASSDDRPGPARLIIQRLIYVRKPAVRVARLANRHRGGRTARTRGTPKRPASVRAALSQRPPSFIAIDPGPQPDRAGNGATRPQRSPGRDADGVPSGRHRPLLQRVLAVKLRGDILHRPARVRILRAAGEALAGFVHDPAGLVATDPGQSQVAVATKIRHRQSIGAVGVRRRDFAPPRARSMCGSSKPKACR